MSTDEKLNAPSATAIRDEVRSTVRQLKKLVDSEKDFDQFCETVLSKVVMITGAYGALFWQVDGEDQLQLTHRSGKLPCPAARDIISQENHLHNRAVMDVIDRKSPKRMTFESLAGQKKTSDDLNPSSDEAFLMLFTPVFNRTRKCCGSLELLQRGGISAQAQEGYLRFLTQISQLFPQWHERQDTPTSSPPPFQPKQEIPLTSPEPTTPGGIAVTKGEVIDETTRASAERPTETAWHDRLEYISEVHRSIDPTETAYAISNEARRLLKCDRVSVGNWSGKKCKITAISSQDRFDNRSNVVRLLSNVATASVSSNSRFWITGSTEGIAPEVARKINAYLDEAHCRTLAVIPLVAPSPAIPDLEMKSRRREESSKLGALILEYFDADVLEDEIESDCKLIVGQAELALENSRKHSEIFLLPLWKRLGWLQQTLFRDHRTKAYTGLATLALLMLIMLFFPKELKMKVDGVMHPSIRKTIFAQTDGIITGVLIDEREDVLTDQPLLILRNRDLELQLAAKRLELETEELRVADAQHQLSSGLSNQDEKRQLGSSIELFKKKIKTFEAQIELLELKKQHLQIVSPIDGTVITPQPRRRYTDYPVTKDLALLEVVDLNGKWQLELKIPQNKIHYVDMALKQRAENQDLEPLEVEFKIGTNPNLDLHGTLTTISRRAVPSESGPPEFRAIVEIGPDQLKTLQDELRSGAGATAKIKCGRRSLGFVCFYQIYDFMRTKVFF